MLIVGVICLIFNYQTVMSSKTFMTNEISMQFMGRKESAPVIMWNSDNNILQKPKYHSSRFERLKAPDEVKPIFVRPAEKQVEEPMVGTSTAPLIEVKVASVEMITAETQPEIQPETSTRAEIISVTYAVPSPKKKTPLVVEEESGEIVEVVTIEPRFELKHFEPLTNEESQIEVEEVTPETTTSSTTTSTQPTTITTSTTATTTTEPTTTTIETTTTVAILKPKKLRHKKRLRKHRKINKSRRTTETPTTVPVETVPIEVETTTVTPEITISPVILVEPPTRPTPVVSKHQNGESYLGGWNEEAAELVTIETTSQPSLGSVMSQFPGSPPGIASSDDEEVQEYYKKYYEEWYRQHNIAVPSPSSPIGTEAPEILNSTPAVPKKINIQLGKKLTPAILPIETLETPTSQAVVPPSSAAPTKEQLDKVCDYVGKLSKSFGIKDTVTFAKNNCAFIKGFHPQATCEQIQHVIEYCSTGVYVHAV